jgi:hypothetical protein
MDPLTIAAAGSVIGGLVQAYNAAKARDANKAELDKIEQKFNELVPPEYDMSITDPPEQITQRIKSPEFANANFDLKSFTPEDYKLVGKYAPEVAQLVKEAAPTLINKTGDMKTGRDAQLKALQRFSQIGAGEFDPEYQEAVTKSRLNAQAEAQSRQNSILQDFARRGQANSGLSLAAQIGGASNAMNTNAMQGLEAASQAYQNRLNALSQGAQLGSQISNEDRSLQAQNADIINAFNQRMAAGQNQYEQNRANMLNQAQLQNLQAAQGIANQNTEARNQAALADRNRLDELAKYTTNRNDDLSKYNYNTQVQERDTQNQLAAQRAAWMAQQKAAQNQLKSQSYDDIYRKTSGAAGMAQQRGQNAMQGAADMNSAISGLTGLGMTYAMAQDKKQQDALNRAAYGGRY